AVEITRLERGIGLDLHHRRLHQRPTAFAGTLPDHLLELASERPLGLAESLAVRFGEEEDVAVGNPHLADSDGLVGVHLFEDAGGQLDRLEPAPKGLGEEAFDGASQPSLELVEDAQWA